MEKQRNEKCGIVNYLGRIYSIVCCGQRVEIHYSTIGPYGYQTIEQQVKEQNMFT